MADLIIRQDAIEALGDEPLVWLDSPEEIAERNQWEANVRALNTVSAIEADLNKDDEQKRAVIDECFAADCDENTGAKEAYARGFECGLQGAAVTAFNRGYEEALKEINTPMRPITKRWEPSRCPRCEEAFDEVCNDGEYEHATGLQRCPYCGQALQW